MAADARVMDMSDLKDLEPLSKRLNAASDELTQALQTVQERLNALGIGVEIWLAESVTESAWSDVLDSREEPTGERQYVATELGYGRHGDGWALLVRNRRYVEGTDDRGFATTTAYDDEQRETALLKASRAVRVAAVPLIPKLLDEIKAEAEHVISTVEQAKKIADSLK